MDWKKERDELIAQTLAFVQSVTAKLPATAPFEQAIAAPRLPAAGLQPEAGAAARIQAVPEPSIMPNAPAPNGPAPSLQAPSLQAQSPEVAGPEAPSPEAPSPGAPSPGAPSPGAPSPGAPSPKAARPALSQPSLHGEIEQEVRTRVARFRAHQERFNRERAEYFDATIARLRAALQDAPPLRAGRISPLLSPTSSPGLAANIPETRPGSRSLENGRGPS
jgi:hypothetical protein